MQHIRNEIEQILSQPYLHDLDRLGELIPEVAALKNVTQPPHHSMDVSEHTRTVVNALPETNFFLRMIALLHDIAKPICRTGDEHVSHFYQHENVGAEIAATILHRLEYTDDAVEYAQQIIKLHMRFNRYDPENYSAKIVMKLFRASRETFYDSMLLAIADCSSDKIETREHVTKRMTHLEETMKKEIISAMNVSLSPLNGNEIIELLEEINGPLVGKIKQHLHACARWAIFS